MGEYSRKEPESEFAVQMPIDSGFNFPFDGSVLVYGREKILLY